MRELAENETVVREGKIQSDPSDRCSDVQMRDKDDKARKVFEAARKPNSKRNKERETQYDDLGIEHEAHPVEP